MINHFYNDIDGWFDYQQLYSNVVNISKDSDHFVEIGAWLGKSTAYMAVEIANSNKNIKFDVIDTWQGSANEDIHLEFVKTHDIYKMFLDNMKKGNVSQYVNSIKMTSHEASKLYNDDSLDFVFIDAQHTYDSVMDDLKCWYPKTKSGKIIAGHDYGAGPETVAKAVNEFFGKINVRINVMGPSWIVIK